MMSRNVKERKRKRKRKNINRLSLSKTATRSAEIWKRFLSERRCCARGLPKRPRRADELRRCGPRGPKSGVRKLRTARGPSGHARRVQTTAPRWSLSTRTVDIPVMTRSRDFSAVAGRRRRRRLRPDHVPSLDLSRRNLGGMMPSIYRVILIESQMRSSLGRYQCADLYSQTTRRSRVTRIPSLICMCVHLWTFVGVMLVLMDPGFVRAVTTPVFQDVSSDPGLSHRRKVFGRFSTIFCEVAVAVNFQENAAAADNAR